MANGKVTNDRIYDLIDKVRVELKTDIIRLESKFDVLEAGRLTRLEGKVSDQDVKQATASTKLAIIGFISASVIGGLISLLPRLIH